MGYVPQCFAWFIIVLQFLDRPSGAPEPLSFVYALVLTELFLFFSFGLIEQQAHLQNKLEVSCAKINGYRIMIHVQKKIHIHKKLMFWKATHKVQELHEIKYGKVIKDTGKISQYDYKTYRANDINHDPLASAVPEIVIMLTDFGVQNILKDYEGKKHAVCLAGNSGLPAGAVGLHMKITKSIKTTKDLESKNYTTQEEDVVKNWLLTEEHKNIAKMHDNLNLIWNEYGMLDYNKTDPKTKQGVNYNNLSKSNPTLLSNMKSSDPFEKFYAEALAVRNAHISPKLSTSPDKYNFDESNPTTLIFVAGPNVGAKGGGDNKSTTLRTFNEFLSQNYSNFKEAIKWTYYAALHAMASEGCRVALLCWISGALYAGPFRKIYGVDSDGKELVNILKEVLNMRCYSKGRETQLKFMFSDVIVVGLGKTKSFKL